MKAFEGQARAFCFEHGLRHQLGIDAESILQRNPRLTWIALSGYGRSPPQDQWCAYGDDAAVAAGVLTGQQAAEISAKRKKLTWPEAKDFAHEVCRRLAGEHPDRFVVNMAKKLRGGKIFLDYLRNDRMATAVAPLSPRARPGATVSMPLTWAQVKADLDPTLYTLRTVPRLLAETKAWADYCDAEQPLEAAIKRLGSAKG